MNSKASTEWLRMSLTLFFDPFNGSGTTCVAAKQTGRTYIGVDLSSDYCQIAEKRLEQTPEFVLPESKPVA